jgi:hypothetical protein
MARAGREVQGVTAREDRSIQARVALRRADITYAAVPVVVVVPAYEAVGPLPRSLQIGEARAGNSGRYFAVRNRLSTNALSSLTRGRE